MQFGWYLARCYIVAFILLILWLTVKSNDKMDKKLKIQFYSLVGLSIFRSIVDLQESYFAFLPEYHIERLIFSTLGYILNPIILYIVVLILMRDDSPRKKHVMGMPLFIFAALMIIDMPIGNIYYFTEDNHHTQGLFFPVTYLILIYYLLVIIVLSFIKRRKNMSNSEFFIIFVGIGFIIFNIVGEVFIEGYENNSLIATSLSVLAYSIYFKNQANSEEKEELEVTEVRTGLYNENACVARINELCNEKIAEKYAVIYFDIKRFSVVNETYGIDVGSRLLIEYAKELSTILKADEIIGRRGSDLFIAVIKKTTVDIFLKRLEGLNITFDYQGKGYTINVSSLAGVYMIREKYISGDEAISNAYLALNYGKSTSKRNVTYLNEELKSTIKDQKQFEADIPEAMSREEFIVYYQPKVNSKTSTLCGAEALVRWIHGGKLIPPGQFIPVLEHNELMCDMDFYMLRHVCQDIEKWIAHGLVPPTISVNFSRRNLSNKKLAEEIDAIVNEYHVPKKMIEIEITETIDEFPISVLRDFVDDLHRLGYRVAVDDFGSGSSSLSLLREVTFDTLKIDKGFVDRAYAKDLTILSYMIKLAIALNIEVLAEGAEQKEQIETLASLGCYIIQGYYYDKPLPKEDFEQRIINRRYPDA
ncbi:MAG: bifunctional diguanylate cyclase/phosphodiesterase [Pseudobutyrivibrio sp.]|nr:bifunctional diguanylate cyclase/phosphodiesterase [Pseudobutyrivibrio sp.]